MNSGHIINVSVTRGDSAYFKYKIKKSDGTTYRIKETDEIKVQVRTDKNPTDNSTLLFNGDIHIDYVKNAIIWRVAPNQTKNLDVGTYYYDMQIKIGEDIFTFVKVSDFVVTDEVTL